MGSIGVIGAAGATTSHKRDHGRPRITGRSVREAPNCQQLDTAAELPPGPQKSSLESARNTQLASGTTKIESGVCEKHPTAQTRHRNRATIGTTQIECRVCDRHPPRITGRSVREAPNCPNSTPQPSYHRDRPNRVQSVR